MELSQLQAKLPMYLTALIARGLEPRTVRKYGGDIRKFLTYCGTAGPLTPQLLADYLAQLRAAYRPNSVNSYLISLNAYLSFLGLPDRVPLLKKQQICTRENILSLEDYHALLDAARDRRQEQLTLILRTLASTGIRIGELALLRVESLQEGYEEIYFKKKLRIVCLPTALTADLRAFCALRHYDSGPIFRGASGEAPIPPSTVWRQMKRLALCCGVDPDRVYPHSFRHMFAKRYMESFRDLTELSDLLGHSSVETTRIYTRTSMREKRDRLDIIEL